MSSARTAKLPLTALLSQVLVAFTIEFDNEFEQRMPHFTTDQGGDRHNPWLVSMAMWWNCMRFVDDVGITARGLHARARTGTNLRGMVRWGYVRIGSDQRIRPTANGRQARQIWEPLFAEMEARWRERFGERVIDDLRDVLQEAASHFPVALPACLPILGYGLINRLGSRDEPTEADRDACLPALLARVLLAYAIRFERQSELSLAICANVLRLLDEQGVRVRDLPRRSGVSKESIRMALGYLAKRGFAAEEAESSGSRARVARLTAKGLAAQEQYSLILAALEERGPTLTGKLRRSLERLVSDPLFGAWEPYPDGWRAARPRPDTLPHFPMVLHRGGYPDGS